MRPGFPGKLRTRSYDFGDELVTPDISATWINTEPRDKN
jgi:hypothetical protein